MSQPLAKIALKKMEVPRHDLNLNNINPQRYLKNLCGYNILTGTRTLEGLASMRLDAASRLKGFDRDIASRVIASSMLFHEGFDIEKAKFDRIVSKLSVMMLHGEEVYRDHIAVANLATKIGWAMGIPADRLKDIRMAALLHDIGKAAGEGAERMVEASSTQVHDKYRPSNVGITVGEASIKLFSLREKIDPNTTIYSVVRDFFPRAEAERILRALHEGLSLKTEEDGHSIGTFWRLHNYFSTAFLRRKVDERVLQIVAMHHILEGVNPMDRDMLQVELRMEHVRDYDVISSIKEEIAGLRRDPALWTDVKILIMADKFDAFLRRSGMDYRTALSTFHAIVRRNHFVEEVEFKSISSALYKLITDDPSIIRHD